MSPIVLIVSDRADDRSGGIAAGLRRRGCTVAKMPLSAIAFDTQGRAGLAIPDLDDQLPDGVIVRSIAAGSFEAITRRLGVLHALGRMGVPVWNSAQAIERCVDKSTTTFLLQNAGIPTPPTVCVEGLEAARTVAARDLAHGPLVLKPLFGAQGRGIRLVQALADLPEPDAVGDVFYLQRFVPRDGPPFHDHRVFVLAGKVLAMMTRRGGDWITNINRGATPETPPPGRQAELSTLAIAATAAVGADFAGVDIVPAADGRLFVIEVNSMPAWSGLQTVADIDIADAIAGAFAAHLAAAGIFAA